MHTNGKHYANALRAIFGPGYPEVEVLLDKHEYMYCIGLETSTSERDGVLPTQENPFNSHKPKKQFKYDSHELKLPENLVLSYPQEEGTLCALPLLTCQAQNRTTIPSKSGDSGHTLCLTGNYSTLKSLKMILRSERKGQ